jgi:hypothetical protein
VLGKYPNLHKTMSFLLSIVIVGEEKEYCWYCNQVVSLGGFIEGISLLIICKHNVLHKNSISYTGHCCLLK